MFLRKINLLLITSLALVGTSGCLPGVVERTNALAEATRAGFQREVLQTRDFELVVYHKGLNQKGNMAIYVEGDGRAWRTQTRISKNPTPNNPVALRLAVRDPSASVVYIARPCQYLTTEQMRSCSAKYWSTYRYAPEVIAATNEALAWALAQKPAQIPGFALGLVGYSGGAAVAALVASQRSDIDWLASVAGNLDHAYWTRLHDITPLYHSLNAADYGVKLAPIAQYHFVGSDDDKVPASVAQSYQRQLPSTEHSRVITVEGYSHGCCWPESWPAKLCGLPNIPENYCP